MAHYMGETYAIPLERGGFNHNKNIDTIPPMDHVYPSRNIWLNEGGIRKRAGTAIIDTYAMFKVGSPTFTGAGLDDLTAGTTFEHTATKTFKIQIDATGTPDTFKWTNDGGANWTTGVSITGAAQTLSNAFTVTFAATTGHTLNEYWTVIIAIPKVTGLFDFTLANEDQFIVRATSDGQLWKDLNDTIKTGWTANKKVHITQWEDEVYFCNGADKPTVWNGSAGSTTDFANVPTDWTGSNYPKQLIQHGRGASLRNWALGCPLNTKTIYVTPSGSPKDFTQATVLTFYIETGDGFGVVAGIEFGDRLILFGKNRSFIMDDSSTDVNNWGYSEAQWTGGVAHHRLMVRIPNDIICMMENGEIYSVTAAEQYGDYRAASLARPSFIHEWIKTYINLEHIADFHAIYDPVLRAVLFFMVRTGGTEIDTCLAYFIDRPPEKAWTILGNEYFESGYSALSSGLIRQSAGNWKIYTGGYTGRLWRLSEADRHDNAEAFVSRIRTPLMAFDNPREEKRYDRIKIVSVSEGTCDTTIRWWIDGVLIDSEDIDFAETGGLLGSFILGTSPLGGPNILESSVKVGHLGKRLQIEALNSVAGEDFFISQFLVDFLPTGKRV